MGYHKNIVNYYNKELIQLYEEICHSNYTEPLIQEKGLEGFSSLSNYNTTKYNISTDLDIFLSSLKKIIKALFIRLDFAIDKLRKNYISLSDNYTKQIQNNRTKLNLDSFLHTKINTVSYDEIQKRIQTVKILYTILENIDKVINSPGGVETPEISKCLTALTSIGYDPNTQNLVKTSVSNRSYKEKYISTTIENHGYTVDKVLRLLSEIKYLDKYTSNNYVATINNKFYNLSINLNNENSPKDAQIKTMRLWICTHFIRTTYTLANHIVNDITDICDVIIKNMDL